ncbi:LppX_LprAFG lipoprotein [Nocardioides sp. CFH 31398]|uniref:LppX_LprAFG lipoprotein n=1 Tax=Nocardioides sp. CFH 31398 TaxID=2919579 RepID=UPI001F057B94|nr:LppX_LprAFG lipoprotein [Nocardioides sp. CFH 31398]MCH1868358.1 LppX_LprAFG lipoprotein [Nocardioides sp. CFH 31398]
MSQSAPAPRPSRVRRTAAAAAGLTVLAGLLAACSGGDDGPGEEGQSPEDVLAEAKQNLDDTPGLNLTVETEELPDGVQGVSSADGAVNRQPAFEGTLGVETSFGGADVPVVAVDDTVYAQLPLGPGWQEVDPEQYGAPDPARLLDTETGFSALLTATEDVEEGETVRGGEDNSEVLTEYTGTVPGEAVQFLIPSAEGDFDAVYTVDDETLLRRTELTGAFYPDTDPITYVITFDDYGLDVDITAPS